MKQFRCDRTYTVKKKLKRRCYFAVSNFKSMWFSESKLDTENMYISAIDIHACDFYIKVAEMILTSQTKLFANLFT